MLSNRNRRTEDGKPILACWNWTKSHMSCVVGCVVCHSAVDFFLFYLGLERAESSK